MNIKKIIRESIDDLDWIRDVSPSLLNSIIYFEPMINREEWDQVLSRLRSHIVTWDENIVWWSGNILAYSRYHPIEEGAYLHHLVISLNGKAVWGGLNSDAVFDLYDEGYSDFDIVNNYGQYSESIQSFVDSHPDHFSSPQMIDGRRYFNLPYRNY